MVPAECECPADRYREEYDCKHKVALATFGGPVVLEPAREFPTTDTDTDPAAVTTAADKLATDGGTKPVETDSEHPRSHTELSRPDECACSPRFSELPCWSCYRDGFETPAKLEEV